MSAFLLTEPDVGSDPARMTTSATPIDDGSAYLINGTKLWATNGTVASLLVVMAVVPPSEGKRGGHHRVRRGCACAGCHDPHPQQLHGPARHRERPHALRERACPGGRHGRRHGRGLKIALTTLNTGRLSLPAMCAASAKLSLKIAREWSNERVQWGAPIGKHEAVALKLAFIAGLHLRHGSGGRAVEHAGRRGAQRHPA